MAPSGTPDPNFGGAVVQTPTVVIWQRDVKNIQASAEPRSPAASNFHMRPSCHTRSNSFFRSKKITPT